MGTTPAIAGVGPGGDAAPLHVAIIMDGNGRWARTRGLPRTAGHKQGAEAVRSVVEASPGLGITHLTLFGFSSENWKRPDREVGDLLSLLRLYLRKELRALEDNNVRLRIIGHRDRFAPDILALFADAEARTERNTGLYLTLALNYGARAEILAAVRAIATACRDGDLAPEAVDEAAFRQRLFTADMPDPDVVIRTSGEQRVSNFLLWQLAYAELVFSPVLWPDFTGQDLAAALADFRSRDRRFGAV